MGAAIRGVEAKYQMAEGFGVGCPGAQRPPAGSMAAPLRIFSRALRAALRTSSDSELRSCVSTGTAASPPSARSSRICARFQRRS